jgi:hypothetical protein
MAEHQTRREAANAQLGLCLAREPSLYTDLALPIAKKVRAMMQNFHDDWPLLDKLGKQQSTFDCLRMWVDHPSPKTQDVCVKIHELLLRVLSQPDCPWPMDDAAFSPDSVIMQAVLMCIACVAYET